MLTILCRVLREECRIDPDRLVLVGVSGGADSLCLLHALHSLGLRLHVAHFDHGLRAESREEAAWVGELAQRLGYPCVQGRGDATAFSMQHALSVEDAARQLRYRFLFEQADLLGVQAVAVGHHAGDQVETVLLHLLRGAGLSGLGGLSYRLLPNAWSERIPLVRPLLDFWREDILAYLQTTGLEAREDASNQDTRYLRNRIRHELLPGLQTYNRRAPQAIWRTARLLRDEAALLQKMEDDTWERSEHHSSPGAISISASILRDAAPAMQRRLLRRAVAYLRPALVNVDYAMIERCLVFVKSPPARRRADLGMGMQLSLEGERLWIADWQAELPSLEWPQIQNEGPLLLACPGEAALENGWRMIASQPVALEQVAGTVYENSDSFTAWLDADVVPMPLVVRPRRAGERFEPLGVHGHSQKLSDLMINAGLPRRLRQRWPIVTSADDVIWVPGLRLAQRARVTAATQRVIEVSCRQVA